MTLIKTSTGIWSVTYNAENRPVRWECGDIVVTMNFDRMGRRVFYKEEVDGVVTKHHKFVYNNYLCVQKLDALNNNAQINLFVWDPTEPIATRPLFTQRGTGYKFFYTCDGNKNVSEMVHFEQRNGIAAHYDYAPFGAVTRAISASAIENNTFTADNPFRFSSEYYDDTLGLVYYNYRHYNPIDGRWSGRDLMEEVDMINLFVFSNNAPISKNDLLGLMCRIYTWGTSSHSALECEGVYISKFPKKEQYIQSFFVKKELNLGWRTLMDDINRYGENYTVTETSCLDEDKVKSWFKMKENDTYWFGFNDCTDAVTDAMQYALKNTERKPNVNDCPQPSICQQAIFRAYAIVEDLLENENFTLPLTVEWKVKRLNENGCKRYKCTIKYPPPQQVFGRIQMI